MEYIRKFNKKIRNRDPYFLFEMFLLEKQSVYIVLYSTIQYYIVLYGNTWYYIVLYSTIQYHIVLYSTIQSYIVVYSTIQYYIVLYSTIQYYIVTDRRTGSPSDWWADGGGQNARSLNLLNPFCFRQRRDFTLVSTSLTPYL